ncbi:hypothetical protein QC761_0064520 [Podospora bellae-mahoneyi]|uniref:Uncharacterized protein n=1 Tax=Podospora bellae-mahoneyi TaxID=2093777 RepID=A0ABR0FGN0_9PEZI|nr:hypothetical protein QC761_0064520 [Podospora bellae-mahoneyi]
MAIKGRLGAGKRRKIPIEERKTYPNLEGYTRPNICRIAALGVISLGLPWNLIRQALAEPALPLHNLPPRTLVEKVVNRNHALDGRHVGVCVTLAQQSIVHLLGGRVLPVSVSSTLGNG